MHLIAPILPSSNYCGNLAHKANECNIPSEDIFCDYCGTSRNCLFYQVLETEITLITTAKSANILHCRSTKNQGTSTFHLGFPHQW